METISQKPKPTISRPTIPMVGGPLDGLKGTFKITDGWGIVQFRLEATGRCMRRMFYEYDPAKNVWRFRSWSSGYNEADETVTPPDDILAARYAVAIAEIRDRLVCTGDEK